MGYNVGTASLVGQLAGGISSGIGDYYSAKVTKTNLAAQADMAKINARIAEMGAQQAVRAGHHEIGRLTLQAGQLKSRQRVALAGAGVDIGTGSAAEIQASSDLLKEIDVNTIASNAARSAWGYRVQGVNYQTEAITKKSAANAISPAMSLGTSLLGTATSVASSWYQMQKSGMFGSTGG